MAIKNDANRRAVAKYKKNHYDQIVLTVPKGEREKIKQYAAGRGESLNGFICRAISEAMERDAEQAQTCEQPNADTPNL